MNDHQAVLECHQQRAANLRAAMLMIELGAGIRVEVPVHAITRTPEQLAVAPQQDKAA